MFYTLYKEYVQHRSDRLDIFFSVLSFSYRSLYHLSCISAPTALFTMLPKTRWLLVLGFPFLKNLFSGLDLQIFLCLSLMKATFFCNFDNFWNKRRHPCQPFWHNVTINVTHTKYTFTKNTVTVYIAKATFYCSLWILEFNIQIEYIQEASKSWEDNFGYDSPGLHL